MPYWPELDHMPISEPMADKKYEIILTPAVPSWTYQWDQLLQEMWAMWYRKQSWPYARMKEDGDGFWDGQPQMSLHCFRKKPIASVYFLKIEN